MSVPLWQAATHCPPVGVHPVLPQSFQGCCTGTFLRRERSASGFLEVKLKRTQRQDNSGLVVGLEQREGLNMVHESKKLNGIVPVPF